jgi:hypothetical protein
MNMKQHILAALGEEFDRWEELLGGMSEEEITAPRLASGWSIKDVIAHLWAWQQRSIARLEGAVLDREPDFPNWPTMDDLDSEDGLDRTNAWIYEAYRDEAWSSVHRRWRQGFVRFLELGAALSERDLLDGERFAWMKHYPVALVLTGSYEHHHLDHLEPLRERLSIRE